jgi:vesicle-associated membrane protein-associated protein A
MSKQDQVLILNPPVEIKFRGPFTEVITTELELMNPSQKRVIFKVKTTAPKRYCVRPNSGLIEAGARVAVSVMLQPFDHDQNEKNKHKFMVQSMFAPDGTIENQDQLWKDATPDQLMDSKLRCVFEPTVASNNLNVSAASGDDNAVLKSANIKDLTAVPHERASPKVTNLDAEVKPSDAKALADQVQQLRTENTRLKDEGLKLRSVAFTESISPSRSQPIYPKPTPQPQSIMTVQNIVFLVIMLILGLIVGKFIL